MIKIVIPNFFAINLKYALFRGEFDCAQFGHFL
jgi:hypothetical protein